MVAETKRFCSEVLHYKLTDDQATRMLDGRTLGEQGGREAAAASLHAAYGQEVLIVTGQATVGAAFRSCVIVL
jgi:hypothetical protein